MARLWSCVLSVALVAAALRLVTAAGQGDKANLLGQWSFDGTFDDVSAKQRGPAVGAGGGDISLKWESDGGPGYVRVSSPGYLNVPRVDFRTTSFTYSFSLRLDKQTALRRFLYSDWSANTWQFATILNPDRKITVWLRNSLNTCQQNFVDLTSTAPVPLGKWVDIAVVWDRSGRVASILIDQVAVGVYTVPWEVDVDMCKSNGPYYQFGGKADDLNHSENENPYAPLDADVRNLRVFT